MKLVPAYRHRPWHSHLYQGTYQFSIESRCVEQNRGRELVRGAKKGKGAGARSKKGDESWCTEQKRGRELVHGAKKGKRAGARSKIG